MNDENEEAKPMNGATPEQEVVYVKEKPFAKLLIGSVVSIVGVFVFLFALGFLMSFTGHRPPTFDKDIIKDQYDKALGREAVSYNDCVEKGGRIQESFPPTCTFAKDSFTQPLEEACEGKDLSDITSDDPCAPYSPARETGEKVGELYEDTKSGAKDFIDGFKEGAN